jgi:hypothetical protein
VVEDLTGKQFGMWNVLYKDNKKYNTRDVRWICECECGTIKSVLGKYLRNGKSISCGCSKKIDLSGQRFGKLVVLETIYDYNGYNRATHKCRCDCGEILYLTGNMNDRNSCIKCSHESHRKDYVGQKFGKLTVVEMLYNYKNNDTYCKCICDCGNEYTTRMVGLVTGNTSSCGCIHSPSLIGNKYGRLTVVEELETDTPQRLWRCKCDCGNEVNVHSYTLTSGHTQSCGCLRSESVSLFEVFISDILKDNFITYRTEFTFENCKGIGNKKLRFDFYLPDYNTLIEYDGMQHFRPVEYFGGEEQFNILKKNDEIKNKYCETHKINLVRIPYTLSRDKVKDIVMSIIQNPVTTTVV